MPKIDRRASRISLKAKMPKGKVTISDLLTYDDINDLLAAFQEYKTEATGWRLTT